MRHPPREATVRGARSAFGSRPAGLRAYHGIDISSDARLTRRAAAELGYRTGRDDTWHRSDRDATRAIPWTRSLLQLEPYPRRGFSTEAGSDTRTGERHMRDSAGRGGGLDVVVLLEALQSVPEAYASAEQERDHHRVHVVDEPGSKEVADHGGTSADADVLAARSLAGRFEERRVGKECRSRWSPYH